MMKPMKLGRTVVCALAFLACALVPSIAANGTMQIVTSRSQLAGYSSVVAAAIANAQDIENGAISNYTYSATSAATQDGANVIVPSDSPTSGRWILTGTQLNLRTQGAKGDAIWGIQDGTINVGSNARAFSSATATFKQTDVGKAMIVGGAGASHAPLVTTIASYVDAHDVLLTDAATNSVPYQEMADILPVYPEAPSSTYAIGATLTVIGGTGTAATAVIDADYVASATVQTAGTGGTNGSCVVTGTTGTPLGGQFFNATVTIASGGISAVNSIGYQSSGSPFGGFYSADPSNKAQEPVTGCGLSGAKLALKMAPALMHMTGFGVYTATPGLTFTATASTGTGAGFQTVGYNKSLFAYGTDDTNAVNVAFAKMIADRAATPVKLDSIEIPAGIYMVKPTAPVMRGGASITGTGHLTSVFAVIPNTAGDVIACSECIQYGADPSWDTFLLSNGNQNSGLSIKGIGIIGWRSSTANQNCITLYDLAARAMIDDVECDYMKGSGISTGRLKNDTTANLIEAQMHNLRFFHDGDTNYPVIDLNSVGAGDGDNEIDISGVDVYAARGVGIAVRNNGSGNVRQIRMHQIRVEGLENGGPNLPYPNFEIGDAVGTGVIDSILCTDCELVGQHFGTSAFLLQQASGGAVPYNISFNGLISGGAPFGAGLNVQTGSGDAFNISQLFSYDYNVIVGTADTSGGHVGHNQYFNGFGAENSWTTNISTSAINAGYVQFPALFTETPGQQSNNLLTRFGYSAGGSMQSTGQNATDFGAYAGQLQTQSIHTNFGARAGEFTNCIGCAAFGEFAMQGNAGNALTGIDNTAIGDYAGFSLQGTSQTNTLLGYSAGSSLNNGTQANVFIGANTGASCTTAVGTVLIGNGVDCKTSSDLGNLNIDKTILCDAANIHCDFGGSAPTVSSCGTSPGAPVGNDTRGHLTAGTGTVALCVLNFAATHGAAPDCWAQDDTTLQTIKCNATTTQMSFAVTTTMASDKITWISFGL